MLPPHSPLRQHTSTYVSIRQHMPAYVRGGAPPLLAPHSPLKGFKYSRLKRPIDLSRLARGRGWLAREEAERRKTSAEAVTGSNATHPRTTANEIWRLRCVCVCVCVCVRERERERERERKRERERVREREREREGAKRERKREKERESKSRRYGDGEGGEADRAGEGVLEDKRMRAVCHGVSLTYADVR
jgi:hypothetical protein